MSSHELDPIKSDQCRVNKTTKPYDSARVVVASLIWLQRQRETFSIITASTQSRFVF